jgi:hypothetical protein
MKRSLWFLLLIFLTSCNADKRDGQNDYTLFDIGKSLSVENRLSMTLNDIAKEIRLIPVATNDSCLMESLFIAGTTETHVISYDKQALYEIDKTDGSVRPVIKRQGRGPGEYRFLMDLALAGDSLMYIYDTGKREFLKYDFEGSFLGSLANDSISSFIVMPDGDIAATTSYYHNNDSFIEVYDRDWNFIRSGIPNDRKDVEFDMLYANGFTRYNGKTLFRDYFGDTIYHVTAQRDIPYLVLSQGRRKIPFEIAADMDIRDRQGVDYIQGIGYTISSEYCFLRYYLREKGYFDIWHIPTSKLLYRNIASAANPVWGIDIGVDGTVIPVWPNFAKDNYIYCVIEHDNARKVMPSLPEGTNPILLEIKL